MSIRGVVVVLQLRRLTVRNLSVLGGGSRLRRLSVVISNNMVITILKHFLLFATAQERSIGIVYVISAEDAADICAIALMT